MSEDGDRSWDAPCGLLRLDLDGVIVAANPWFAQMLGVPAAALTGRPLLDLIPPAGRVAVQTVLWPKLSAAGSLEEAALDFRRPDGERVPALVNARVERDAQGAPRGALLAVFRAAAKRAYEAEVPRARAQAASAMRVKHDFLANVSHELRTPLNGVLGVSAALAATPLSAPQREMLAVVETSGRALERLVGDILEISKLEAGGLSLQPEPFSPGPLLATVIDLYALEAAEKGLRFHSEIDPAADGAFVGDGLRVRQVFGALLSNAVKFTPAGSVSASVALRRSGEGAALVMTVRDSGVGFDPERRDELFEAFSQADTRSTRNFGGLGVGLSLTKALVDLMGGEIDVRSQPGRGSVFRVSVPLDSIPDAVAAPGDPPPAPHTAANEDEPPLRVLLVEDNAVNQQVVRLILEPCGVDLTVADDGAQGLAAFQAGVFDLVLMDVQMPVMDGLTATRGIRAFEAARVDRPRTPVVVVSANALDEHRQQSLAAGADLHICKPLTPARLLDGVNAALSLPSAAA